MSDDKPSDTPTDNAAPEVGFTPAPEPPTVDPSEVVPSEAAAEPAAAPVMRVVEASVQEPAPVAKAANDEAQRRLEALSSVVL